MCHKSKYCPCGNKAGMCQFDVDKILDEEYEEMYPELFGRKGKMKTVKLNSTTQGGKK